MSSIAPAVVRVERMEIAEPPQAHASAPDDGKIDPESALHFCLSAFLNIVGLVLSLILTHGKARPTTSMLLGLATNWVVAGELLSIVGAWSVSYRGPGMLVVAVFFILMGSAMFYFCWLTSKTACTLKGRASDFVLNLGLNIVLPVVALPFSAFQKRRRAFLGGCAGLIMFDSCIILCICFIAVIYLGAAPAIVGAVVLGAHVTLFFLCISKAAKDNLAQAESLTYFALVFAFGPIGIIPGIFAKSRAGRYSMYFAVILLAFVAGVVLAVAVSPVGGIALCVGMCVLAGLLAWVLYDRSHGHNQ